MPSKILIIDDDAEIRKLLGILLSQAGYQLRDASCAEDAFHILAHDAAIGAVICDIKIQAVDGIQILEHIKRDYAALPVVMLTALFDLHVAVDAMKRGAFDFLTKPVLKNDLVLAVEKALNYKSVLDENLELRRQNQQFRQRLRELHGRDPI